MNAKEYVEKFPAEFAVPTLILELLKYQDEVDNAYSGTFELRADEGSSLFYWFGKDLDAASQFGSFGADSDGSLYAFWLLNNRDLETAPIVFLGSEGSGNTVLSDNLRDFFSLLAIGQEELGFAVESPGWHQKQVPDENTQQFRNWLKSSFDIEEPEGGEAFVAQAKSKHPDLQTWIEQWQSQQS